MNVALITQQFSDQNHWQLCRVVNWLYTTTNPNRQAFLGSNPTLFSATDNIVFIPANTSCPAGVVVYDGTNTAVIWAGSSAQQQASLIESWRVTTPLVGPYGELRCFASAWAYTRAIPPVSWWNCSGQIFFVGHSYGGALAVVAGYINSYVAARQNDVVYTYGAPRAGTANLSTSTRLSRVYQFHTLNDPVSYLPPHTTECPSLMSLQTVATRNFWNSLVCRPTGYLVASDGEFIQREPNDLVGAPIGLNILQWATGTTGLANSQHSINTYIQCFNQVPLVQPSPPPQPLPNPPQSPMVETPQQRAANIAIGTAEIFADASDPSGVTANLSIDPASFPTLGKYYKHVQNHHWGVYQSGALVAACKSKRAARSLAHKMNLAAKGIVNV